MSGKSGNETEQQSEDRVRRLFGLTALALVGVGGLVLMVSTGGVLELRDFGAIFAGGSFASAWIAFEHWRTGRLINV